MEGAIAFQNWVIENPLMALGLLIILSTLLFFFTRNVIARGLVRLASRTTNKVDDIFIKHLRPTRLAWLAPLVVIYVFAYLLPAFEVSIRKVTLFLIILVSVLSINALLNAFNEIYESRPSFNGVSIQTYLDVLKIFIAIVAIILSISLFSGQSPGNLHAKPLW